MTRDNDIDNLLQNLAELTEQNRKIIHIEALM